MPAPIFWNTKMLSHRCQSPTLLVLHETTPDFGERPWPPLGDDHWRIVKRECGFTLWRRLALTNQTIQREDANAGLIKPNSVARQDKRRD
jgi:hypothetical protein